MDKTMERLNSFFNSGLDQHFYYLLANNTVYMETEA